MFWNPGSASHNNFSTAPTANGPWTSFVGLAPWAPRASAALASSPSATVAWLGSGVTMVDGNPVLPSFGDVWQIDAGVCLLGGAAGGAPPRVCSGHGVPDLGTVTCACSSGYSGARCELGSGAAPAAPPKSNAAGITAAVLLPLSLLGFILYAGGPVAALALAQAGVGRAYSAVQGAVGVARGGGRGFGSSSAGSAGSAEAAPLKATGYGAI